MSNRFRRRVVQSDDESDDDGRQQRAPEDDSDLPKTLVEVQALADEYATLLPAFDEANVKSIEFIRKEQTGTLKSLAATCDELQKAAVAYEEIREENDEDAEALFVDVDTSFRKLLDAIADVESRKVALQEVENKMRANALGAVSPNDLYNADVQAKLVKYKAKTSRQRYGKNTMYEDFRNAVWEVRHDGEAMEAVVLLIPAESGDEDAEEDEVVAGATTVNYRCPITQLVLEDPVTSQVCNHTYSSKAIKEMIQRAGREGCKCPAGCNSIVRLSDLKENTSMAERVKNFKRRQTQRDAERRATQAAGSIFVD